MCDAKHFEGNKELDRKCNLWQEGEIALEMVWWKVILADIVSSGKQMVLELGSMWPKRRRLQSQEITIGIEIHREVITELKLFVEDEEETKSREKKGEKKIL